MKQFSLLEIVSTAVLLANVVVVVVDLSRVFHVIDATTLQAAHRCTHAPHGTLAALPTFCILEIVSTAVLLANAVVVVADLSGVFHVIDSAALQAAHRCTHAPYGMLAALPTHSFGDVDHLVIQIFALHVRCRLVLQ